MLYHFVLLLMSYCAVFKDSQTHYFVGFLRCLKVSTVCVCRYIASLFVINMEGMVMFLWLSGVVIREYAECPFTHRHLSVVCSVFTTILTVRILQNIYSVTDHTYCIMSVSGQCTFVFQ